MSNAVIDGLRLDAKELIGDFGRDAVLVRTRTTANDTDAPWHGPGDTALSSKTVKMAFFDASSFKLPGEVIRGDMVALVAADDVDQNIPTPKDTVTDGGRVYKIVDVVEVRPGEDAVVYTLHLRA